MIGQLRWLDVLAKFFHLAPQQQTNKQTNKHDKNKAIIQPPIRSEQDWLKRELPLCIIDQNKFFSLQKESAKSKAGLPILATNQQSTGFASFCLLKCSWRGKGGAGGGEGEP